MMSILSRYPGIDSGLIFKQYNGNFYPGPTSMGGDFSMISLTNQSIGP